MTTQDHVFVKYFVYLFLLSRTISTTTVFLIEVCRHGSRKPEGPLPTFTPDLAIESYSDLTLTGMREHFNLGSLIKNKFQNLFTSPIDSQTIKIYASSNHRTVNSAISQVAGLDYRLNNQRLVDTPEESTLWSPPNTSVTPAFRDQSALPFWTQLFPLDVMDRENNFMFAGRYTCTKVAQKNKQLVADLKKKYADLFTPSFKMYGLKGMDPKVLFENKQWDISNAIQLSDIILSQIYDNPSYQFDYETLLHSQYINSFNEYLKGSTRWVNRMVNHELVTSWILWLNKLKSRKQDPSTFPKMVLYSGHDTNIASLKNLLINEHVIDCMEQNYKNIVSKASIKDKDDYEKVQSQLEETQCFGSIPFASSIIFEVFEEDGKNQNTEEDLTDVGTVPMWVRFWLNNTPVKVDGKTQMTLKEFIKYLKSLQVASFDKECGASNLQPKNQLVFLKIFVVVMCLFVFIMAFLYIGILAYSALNNKREEKTLKKSKSYDSLEIDFKEN